MARAVGAVDDGQVVPVRPLDVRKCIGWVVPKAGVRLNLADLVEDLPAGVDLFFVSDINERGDLIGFGFNSRTFLLERLPTHQ